MDDGILVESGLDDGSEEVQFRDGAVVVELDDEDAMGVDDGVVEGPVGGV